MKSLLVGAAMLLAGATNALATDPSAAKSWLGTYAGITVNWDKIRAHDFDYGDPTSDDKISGASLYLGTNFFDLYGFVFGVESEMKIGGADLNDGDYLTPLEQRYSSTTKLRAGYAIRNFMPYATIGVAVGDFEARHGSGGESKDFWRLGFAWGGGLDWAITPKLVLRAEYTRTQYGTKDINWASGGDPHSVEIETDEFKIGGAYKF